MAKPKVAFYWCASCGGCEEAVVDLAEDILKVVEAVDIVFWPVALDFKTKDVEEMPDGSIAVSFINGAIRSSEQGEMVKMLRKKSGLVVAFGSCAHLGGIPGLTNLYTREETMKRAYLTTPSTDNKDSVIPMTEYDLPEGKVTLPELWDRAYALDQIIDVDYYLPGCSVPKHLIVDAVMAILEGKLPPKGTVLSPNKALCETCKRNETKPDKLKIDKIKRVWEVDYDPEKCFLDQGIICMGPATRGGCEERCIEGNFPCRGCFGPTDQVMDQGSKMLSALASILDTNDEEEIQKIVDTVIDPVGTFYRFSIPKGILEKKIF